MNSDLLSCTLYRHIDQGLFIFTNKYVITAWYVKGSLYSVDMFWGLKLNHNIEIADIDCWCVQQSEQMLMLVLVTQQFLRAWPSLCIITYPVSYEPFDHGPGR